MKLTAIITAAAAVIGTAAQADDTCHAFADNKIRLACYDSATSYVAPVKASVETKSKWVFVESKDEMTGKNDSYVYIEAPKKGGGSDAPRAIILRCDTNGGYELLTTSQGYWGGRDNIKITYKFGDNDPITERWSPSTDGTAAFLPDGYNDFRTALLTGDHTKIIIRVEDYQGSEYTSIFDGATIDSKVNFVVSGCDS